MATYGRSGTTTPDPTDEAIAVNMAAIDALMDQVRYWRQRLAHLDDNVVEPDDIRVDDEIRNWERDTE